LAQSFDPATREALLARVRFYRDLGLTEFYRRPVDPALIDQLEMQTAPTLLLQSAPADAPGAPGSSAAADRGGETRDTNTHSQSQEGQPIAPRKPFPAPPEIATAVPAADRAQFLTLIREDIGDCTRCALHKGRNKLVFGDGNPAARLMFVGEGPGADEDAQGLPFVGKAGQLLNNMIGAMGLARAEVYIANIVKCRPPGNRVPEPAEANTCSQFLLRQIDVVRPEAIVALGATAATYLLGVKQSLGSLRGRWHNCRGAKLAVTYHPAFLLRDPRQKAEAWKDLQMVMRELGLAPPARK
jgi:DNA polymerase